MPCCDAMINDFIFLLEQAFKLLPYLHLSLKSFSGRGQAACPYFTI